MLRREHGDEFHRRVLIDVVPEGSWRMILMVSGYALVDTQVTVPSDPREIAR